VDRRCHAGIVLYEQHPHGARLPGRLLVAVGRLVVRFYDDELEPVVEADVDPLAVGAGDLDLPGGAVLGVALDGVGPASSGDGQRGRTGLVGAGPFACPSPSSVPVKAIAVALAPAASAMTAAIVIAALRLRDIASFRRVC